MDESWNIYSTSGLYDSVARSESLEEYKAILESITNQKQNWIRTINNIMRENSFTAKTMAELCGVSRQSVQKWMKGAIPKSRDTYIKIGFAANYDLEDMNYFLQRYGCCNKLYPKCLEDSVYIFVLTSDCIEHSYKSCETIIKMLKEEISAGDKEQSVEDYSTSSLVMDIKKLNSLKEMISFVSQNAQIYKHKYYKLYSYIEEHIQKNLLHDENDSVYLLANSQKWSSSLRQCVSEISQKKWYPQRNKIISLGIHLNMNVEQINRMLQLAQMEDICAKNPFENAIIYALENAELEDKIHCDGTSELCKYVKDVLISLDFEDATFFLQELQA